MSGGLPSGEHVYLAAGVTVRPAGNGGYQVAWGCGSQREYFTTGSPQLAALLATAPRATTVARERRRLEEGLGTAPGAADRLFGELVTYGYWQRALEELTPGDQDWLHLGWSDALELHRATRGTIWSHDYRGDPQVMTRRHIHHPVEPSTPPPERHRPPYRETITLPAVRELGEDFLSAQATRRTHRDFRDCILDLEELATVLALAFRPQFPAERPELYTAVTYSLGAPFHAYLITGRHGVPAGLRRNFAVYHYDAEQHQLGWIGETGWLDRLDALLWRQSYVNDAPVMMAVCVDWLQYQWKYRVPRGYRFVWTECGAFLQTVLLVATALGLKSFQTPAIDDAAMVAALRVKDSEVAPLYVAALGRKPG